MCLHVSIHSRYQGPFIGSGEGTLSFAATKRVLPLCHAEIFTGHIKEIICVCYCRSESNNGGMKHVIPGSGRCVSGADETVVCHREQVVQGQAPTCCVLKRKVQGVSRVTSDTQTIVKCAH